MKSTALLAAFLSTLAVPVLAHPGLPGHTHGMEAWLNANTAPYLIGVLVAPVLLYLFRRAIKA